jgi:hypothetical protein
MKKVQQPIDSVWAPKVVTKQADVVVEEKIEEKAPEVEVLGSVKITDDAPEENVKETKVETKKASKKKDAEDDDVVPLSFINKASESSDK